MEFYSRDKAHIRIVTGLAFLAFFVVIGLGLHNVGLKTFIEKFTVSYFMSPHFIVYILYLLDIIFLLTFTLIQMESVKYGMKKRVIDNYLYYPAAMFLSMTANIHLTLTDHYRLASIFAALAFVCSAIICVKSQRLKQYMYSDEVRVFQVPFSYAFSWNLCNAFMSVNLMFDSMGLYQSIAFRIAMCIVQLLIVTLLCAIALRGFSDKIFSNVQVAYMVSVAISAYHNGYFMPIGYLYFLAVVVIMVIDYKAMKAKKHR